MLERVSKTVGTIARQNDGREWQDQTYVDNVKLKGDVEKRIAALRTQQNEIERKLAFAQNKEPDFWEVGNEPSTTSPTSTSMIEDKIVDYEEPTSGPVYEYYDPGSHWCSQCMEIIPDIASYFKHLHCSKHWQHVDPNDQMWKSKKFCRPKPKPTADQQATLVPLKGEHYFINLLFIKLIVSFRCSISCAYQRILLYPMRIIHG